MCIGHGHAHDVGDRGEAARSDDGDRHGLGEVDGGIPIDAGQHTVAVDIGVDDGCDAGALEFLRQLDDAEARRLGPAFDRYFATLGVNADGHLARKSLAGLLDQIGIAYRHRAEDDAGEATVKPVLDLLQRADAAAELHRVPGRLEDGADRRGIDALALEGAIEIDDVQPFEALHLESFGLGRRIIIVDRGGRHVAVLQAHAFAVLEVYCRKQDHAQAPSTMTKWPVDAASRNFKASWYSGD